MDHESLRQAADSWGLVALVVIFAAIVLLTFRRGAKAAHDDARMIPFREDRAED